MRRRFLIVLGLTALSLPAVLIGGWGIYLMATHAQDEDRARGAVGLGALLFAILLLAPAAWLAARLKQR